MNLPEIFGIVAGLLAFAPCPMYLYAMVRSETKPDRVTWWILALESGLIAATYHSVGAVETIWLPVGYTASFTIIALFSLKYGDGPFELHTLDRVCLIGALLAIFVWQSLDDAFLALLMTMMVEMVALFPTAVKAYTRPETEDKGAWVVTTVASIFNVLAIASFTWGIALYPIYVFITNTAITYFIVWPRKKNISIGPTA
jgi:hypothetical protein